MNEARDRYLAAGSLAAKPHHELVLKLDIAPASTTVKWFPERVAGLQEGAEGPSVPMEAGRW